MKIKSYYKQKEYIHYSNCHEDASILLENAPIKTKHILSVASSLDNSLALLLLNPEKVTSFDYNITQIYLCNLKKTAISILEYEEFLEFIKVVDGDSVKIYEKIKKYLDNDTRTYFDENIFLIEKGIIHCGRFEYYFQVFKEKVLPLVHNKKRVDCFMQASTLEEQVKYYDKHFNNIRFKLMFKIFFSKSVMSKLGRDKEFFKYSQDSLTKIVKERFEKGIKYNLNKDNPYLQYVLYNEFKTLPLYLEKENFQKIKQNIDKLEIVYMSFDKILENNQTYDYMNLSDIFEYMPNEKMEYYESLITNKLNNGGRVLFWNMMNTRKFTKTLKDLKISNEFDRALYYKNTLLYECEKND